MQEINYKLNKSEIVLDFFTEAEELPFHRYFLAVKLAILHSETSADTNSIESQINDLKMLINSDSKKEDLLSIIAKLQTSIFTLKNDMRLDLASIFPLVKSINGIDLSEKSTIDECISLAKKYAEYIPVSAIKKKVNG